MFFLKKNLQKYLTYFQILGLYFSKLPQILGPIQILVNSLKKHDYKNLPWEVHANKSQEMMYPIYYYYSHKIIYLLIFLFRDPIILLLTLLFV
jgi:hypothetical protein